MKGNRLSRRHTSPGPPENVIDPADERRRDTAGLAPGFAAARARPALIALLFTLAGIAWWSTADRMRGMDDGPGTDLGTLSWFVGVWVVMMAAMMFPSVSPTVALYSRMARSKTPAAPLVFAAGYLLAWAAAGLLAYGVSYLGSLLGPELSWYESGRWLAGGTIVVAAVYELTPLKDVCLAKCRSPLGFLLGAWRDGLSGALGMGVRQGGWCVGCCWALMASLFALGVMSLAWMAFVAALIAAEKTLPWGRAVTLGIAALLLLLGVVLMLAPDAIPGLTLPDNGSMDGMGGADLTDHRRMP
jgi:predicted metal-binding membrane protein